ncbi:MAG: hypothetical protein IJB86_02950 [Clostridia bacterium]|nr:hypothetical protein [Clostridia bacterium]
MKSFLRFIGILLLPVMLFSCGRSENPPQSDDIIGKDILNAEEIANHDCDKHGHVYSKATCREKATCYYCGDITGDYGDHDRTKPTCQKKSFCTVCGEEFGGYYDHIYSKATCAGPASCIFCGLTSGSALSHNFKAATCVSPSMCTGCMKKQGSALGHSWTGGSCTQGKVCTRCSYTAEPPGHKMSDTSCTKDSVCSVCGYTVKATGHSFEDGKCTVCGKTSAQAEDESRLEEQTRITEAPSTAPIDKEALCANVNSALDLITQAHALCQSAIDDIYGEGNAAALQAVEKLQAASSVLNNILDQCNTDTRLSSSKALVTAAKKPLEAYINIAQFHPDSILKTVVDMRSACTEAKTACEKLIKHIETL